MTAGSRGGTRSNSVLLQEASADRNQLFHFSYIYTIRSIILPVGYFVQRSCGYGIASTDKILPQPGLTGWSRPQHKSLKQQAQLSQAQPPDTPQTPTDAPKSKHNPHRTLLTHPH